MSSTQRMDGVAMETNNIISEDLALNGPKIMTEKNEKDTNIITKESNTETTSEVSSEQIQPSNCINNSAQTVVNHEPVTIEPNNKYAPADTPETIPFIGLVNQGMTCYLNSLLQSLYMTPEFRDIVFSWQFPQRVAKSIPFEIQKLFILLQTTNRSAVETTDLTKSFGWDFSEVLQQHDVQELWRVMFDALEFSFNNTQEVTRVKKLYEGRMIDYVRCLACNKIKSRPDLFQDIPLPVRPFGKDVGYSSLEEALVGFVQPEKLEGNNQYFCDACGKKCDAHKGLAFTKFPYILTMQLKRFDFDYNTQHRIKLNDRVTFPEYLDLNNMITNGKLVLTPDGVNTGVSINNYHADSYCKTGDEPVGEVIYCETNFDGNENHTVVLDCDKESTNGGTPDSTSKTAPMVNDNELKDTVNEDGPNGPYYYELFSVLIHSGSAVGGHYYAYIKNLDSGKWYCFDDRNVTQISAEQISEVYGGKTIRGSHTRSTNAYMLMYRQINKQKNMNLIQNEQLPQHIQEIIKKMNSPEEGSGESLCSSHRDMYRLRVWYRQHETDFSNSTDDVQSAEKLSPRPPRVVRLYTFADSTLNEVTTESFERLGLHHSMRRELARLVKFNEATNTVECSFDGHEEEPVGKLLDGSYHHSLLLETRKDDAEFKTYLPDSIYSRVYLINVDTGEVHDIKEVTANLKQRVQSYKELIAQIFNINLSSLKVVVERPNEKPFLLYNDDSTLGEQRCDSMCRYYVTDSDTPDILNCKSFEGSELYKLVTQLLNTIQVTVILPPLEADNDYPIGDNAVNNGPWSSRFTDNIEMKDSDTEKEKDKEKNHVKDIERDDVNISPQRTLLEDQELAGVEGKWQFCCRDPSLRLTGVKRRVQAMIDCRGNVGWLRSKLAKLVGAESPEHVSIYTFNGGGSSCETENECTTILQTIDDLVRTSSPLMEINHALELRVYVRPPLALGEYRGRVYTLDVEEPDCTKPLDFTINDTWTIGQVKKAVLKELKEQRNIDWSYDSCRMRKKSWKYATKVYPDFEIVGEVLRVTSGWEMYIQRVPAGQKLFSKELDGLFIFARQYFPSSGTFGQYKEFFLPNGIYEEFKEKMKGEGIAFDNLEFTLGHCSYPCEPSTYSINSSPDWVKASAETVPWWYSKIQSDGNVIFYKNTQEFIKDYKDKFQTPPSTSNYMPEYGKPLKIHIEQPLTLQTNNNTETNTFNPHNSAFALTNETLIAASKYLRNLSNSFTERNRMYGSNENMEIVESVPRNVTPNEDYNYNNNFIRDNQEQFKDPIGLTDAKPSSSSFIPYHERSLKIYINRPSSTTNTSCSDIADNTVSSSVSPSTTDDTLVNNLPISDDMVTSTSDSPLNGIVDDGNLSDSHVKTPSNESMDTAEAIVKTTTEIAANEDASSHKR